MIFAGNERARRYALAAAALAYACEQDPSRELGERLGLDEPTKVRSLVTGWEDTQRYYRFVAPPAEVEGAAARIGLSCRTVHETGEALTPAPLERWEWSWLRPAGSATVDWWRPELLREPTLCSGVVIEEHRWSARYRLAFERETGLSFLQIDSP